MKSLKKILSIFAAFMMVVGLTAANVKAAEQTVPSNKGGTGSITITNTTIGQSYGVYKIFNGTNGDNGAVAYTATSAVKTLLGGENSPFIFDNPVGDEWQVEIKANTDNTAIINFLKEKIGNPKETDWTVPSGIEETVAPTQATDTSMKFTDLKYGYYFVSSSLGSVVTINAANPSIEVIDKNQQGPTTEDENLKKIIKNGEKQEVSANFGDTINYEMSIVATNYEHTTPIDNYRFEDTLKNGLNYVMKDGKVDVTVTVTPKSTITEQKPNGSSIDVTAQATVAMGTGNQSFVLTLPWATGDAEKPEFIYETNSIVKVTYSAVVQNVAELNSNINTTNTGKFGYTTFTETPHYPEKGENSTTVKTYGLAILKTDEKGNGLSGAQFTVTPAGTNTPIKVSGPTQDKDGNNVYLYDKNGTSTITTPSNGVVIIKGIANENTDTSALNYIVKETVAPNGYNLLQEEKTVTAQQLSESTSTIKWYKDTDKNVTTEITEDVTETPLNVNAAGQVIVNTKGTQLPSTGGMGTTMIYIAGAILMVGAAIIFVTNKRMKHE